MQYMQGSIAAQLFVNAEKYLARWWKVNWKMCPTPTRRTEDNGNWINVLATQIKGGDMPSFSGLIPQYKAVLSAIRSSFWQCFWGCWHQGSICLMIWPVTLSGENTQANLVWRYQILPRSKRSFLNLWWWHPPPPTNAFLYLHRISLWVRRKISSLF